MMSVCLLRGYMQVSTEAGEAGEAGCLGGGATGGCKHPIRVSGVEFRFSGTTVYIISLAASPTQGHLKIWGRGVGVHAPRRQKQRQAEISSWRPARAT